MKKITKDYINNLHQVFKVSNPSISNVVEDDINFVPVAKSKHGIVYLGSKFDFGKYEFYKLEIKKFSKNMERISNIGYFGTV